MKIKNLLLGTAPVLALGLGVGRRAAAMNSWRRLVARFDRIGDDGNDGDLSVFLEKTIKNVRI